MLSQGLAHCQVTEELIIALEADAKKDCSMHLGPHGPFISLAAIPPGAPDDDGNGLAWRPHRKDYLRLGECRRCWRPKHTAATDKMRMLSGAQRSRRRPYAMCLTRIRSKACSRMQTISQSMMLHQLPSRVQAGKHKCVLGSGHDVHHLCLAGMAAAQAGSQLCHPAARLQPITTRQV